MLTKPVTPQQALERLRDRCNRAEHCTGELRQKLYTMGIRGSAADDIIARLESERLVDDERFAAMFVRSKVVYARWGRRKIQMAMIAKRLPSHIIRHALDTIDEEQYAANLDHLLRQKAASLDDPDTYEGRTKIFRYGASRGYEPDRVADAVRRLSPFNTPQPASHE